MFKIHYVILLMNQRKTRKPSDKDVVTETAADIISIKDGVRAVGQGAGRQPLDAERRKHILA